MVRLHRRRGERKPYWWIKKDSQAPIQSHLERIKMLVKIIVSRRRQGEIIWRKWENPGNRYSAQPGKAGAPEARPHHDVWMKFSLCISSFLCLRDQSWCPSRCHSWNWREYLCAQPVWATDCVWLETIELDSTWFWGLGSLRSRFQQIPAASWITDGHHLLCPPHGKRLESALGSLVSFYNCICFRLCWPLLRGRPCKGECG